MTKPEKPQSCRSVPVSSARFCVAGIPSTELYAVMIDRACATVIASRNGGEKRSLHQPPVQVGRELAPPPPPPLVHQRLRAGAGRPPAQQAPHVPPAHLAGVGALPPA